MNTQAQARNLMMRHTKNIHNRQNVMLGRTAAEIGAKINPLDYHESDSNIVGRRAYDRSGSALS
jgi:hypothetical protein